MLRGGLDLTFTFLLSRWSIFRLSALQIVLVELDNPLRLFNFVVEELIDLSLFSVVIVRIHRDKVCLLLQCKTSGHRLVDVFEVLVRGGTAKQQFGVGILFHSSTKPTVETVVHELVKQSHELHSLSHVVQSHVLIELDVLLAHSLCRKDESVTHLVDSPTVEEGLSKYGRVNPIVFQWFDTRN